VALILQFAALGLGVGAVYALTAFGVVLVYRGSGVVNFASGAIATVGVFVYYQLTTSNGWSWPLAMAAGVLSSGTMGALTYLLIMKPMRRTSPLARTIATLGVLIVANAALVMIVSPGQLVVASFYPKGALRIGNNLAIGYDRLVILSIALCLALVLSSFWRWSRFGLATTAVAQNRLSSSALGISPDLVATVNWFVGCAIAGFAGIILAPIIGLQITTITGLLFPALAAALLGNMVSFTVAFGGGLGIGIVQSIMQSYYPATPGWATTIPFVLIVVIMMIRGRGIPARGEARDRLPAVGSGRIKVVPLVVGLIALLCLAWRFGSAWSDATTTTMSIALMVLSVVVITGYAGQLSLCQFAFGGVGAFVVGRSIVLWGLPLELAMVAGIVVGVVAGLLVGIPALRSRGVNLAVVTLGFAVVLQQNVFSNGKLSTIAGDNVGAAHIFGIDINSVDHPARYATFTIVVFLLAALWVAKLRRGTIGRRLIAVRESERAAAALGIDVFVAKLFAFATSAGLAALAGIILAIRSPVLTYDSSYDYIRSINVLLYGVVGGVGSLVGPVLSGASVAPGGLVYQLISFLRNGNDQLLVLIGGIGVIFVLWTAPDGLSASIVDQAGMVVRALRLDKLAARLSFWRQREMARTEPIGGKVFDTAAHRATPRTLTVLDVTVRFGGAMAVDNISLTVGPGEVVGLIGPNGAGKTTLIDAITGYVKPASGKIELDGEDISAFGAARRSRLGIGRSFQNLELFEDLTVYENIQAASDSRLIRNYLTDAVLPRRSRLSEPAAAAVRRFGLEGDLDRHVSELPYGRRRLCAIARAVAAEPSVLLLDEPAAGLGEVETEELASLVRTLAKEHGVAILLIEHDIEMLMSVSDRVVALEFGRQVAAGKPQDVRQHKDVLRAYMGEVPAGEEEPAVDALDAQLAQVEGKR
jgi:ABC-type branched-subunit amino acid transport system ATPase component/branched-subunit amino acid ABC-type transport system permease component